MTNNNKQFNNLIRRILLSVPSCSGSQSSYVTKAGPAVTKANTQEAGADVKESGLFSGGGSREEKGLTSQSPAPGKMGDACHKAHLHLSEEAEVFTRREMGTEQRDGGRGLKKFSKCRRAQSIRIRQVMVR